MLRTCKEDFVYEHVKKYNKNDNKKWVGGKTWGTPYGAPHGVGCGVPKYLGIKHFISDFKAIFQLLLMFPVQFISFFRKRKKKNV